MIVSNSIRTTHQAPIHSIRQAASSRHSESDDYGSLTSLLSSAQKESLLDDINKLRDLSAGINKVVQLAENSNYLEEESFFSSNEFELYAFAAVYEKKLASMQFGSLMMVRAALSEGIPIRDFAVVPLFLPGGAISTNAWKQLGETIDIEKTNSLLDKEGLAAFFEIMRSLPASEQKYVVIPDHRRPNAIDETISQALNIKARFNIFCSLNKDWRKSRMLFSLGMAKALLDVTGTDRFGIKFVVALSTPESLRMSMIHENAREFLIHTHRYPAPATADSYSAPPLDFMYHDLYHACMSRFVPERHRLFYLQLASVFNPELYENRLAKHEARQIYETLINLDIIAYRLDLGRKAKESLATAGLALLHVVDEILPATRQMYTPLPGLSAEEARESDLIAKQMGQDLACYFCLWLLKSNQRANFLDLQKQFMELSTDFKSLLGQNLLEVSRNINWMIEPLFTKLFKLDIKQIAKVLEVLRMAKDSFSIIWIVERYSFVQLIEFSEICDKYALEKERFLDNLFKNRYGKASRLFLFDKAKQSLVLSDLPFFYQLCSHGINLNIIQKINVDILKVLFQKKDKVISFLEKRKQIP